ncbi:MAG: ribonuclease HI family protein [bacterium]|nr:ribonuclease HI family protein [bacterium]MBU1918005.1 ribonuclease HI family protein [bacterium]
MTTTKKPDWIVFTDGASRGNPGLAGAGAVIYTNNNKLLGFKKFLGIQTNNQAEYEGLILALTELKKLEATNILLNADSELMIKQLNGIYRVKNPKILDLYIRAQKIIKDLRPISFVHVPRNENKKADLLANMAIDEKDALE